MKRTGEMVGLNTQSLREHFNCTISDPPKQSDLDFLGVIVANVPPEPKSIGKQYTMSASVVGDAVVVEWVEAPRPVQEAQQRRSEWDSQTVSEVKQEARRRIDAIAPDYERENANALWISLLEKRQDGDTLTAGQIAKGQEIRAMRQQINAVRDASNTIEAQLSTLTDEQADAVDITTHPAWPV